MKLEMYGLSLVETISNLTHPQSPICLGYDRHRSRPCMRNLKSWSWLPSTWYIWWWVGYMRLLSHSPLISTLPRSHDTLPLPLCVSCTCCNPPVFIGPECTRVRLCSKDLFTIPQLKRCPFNKGRHPHGCFCSENLTLFSWASTWMRNQCINAVAWRPFLNLTNGISHIVYKDVQKKLTVKRDILQRPSPNWLGAFRFQTPRICKLYLFDRTYCEEMLTLKPILFVDLQEMLTLKPILLIYKKSWRWS